MMVKELLDLFFQELLWIPWALLFLTGNMCWKRPNEKKLHIVWEKKGKKYHEVATKKNVYACLIVALFWLIFAHSFGYGINPLFWLLFSINQAIWITARAKYNRFLKKHLIILESPEFPSSNKKQKLFLGKIYSPSLFPRKFYLSLTDLRKHMYICGLTGMGKSNFIQLFLTNFYKQYSHIPFLVIEFKGEYQRLRDFIPNIQYVHPGEHFSLNIFDPMNSDSDTHAERLFDILRSCEYVQESSEFSPQMEKVLVDILKTVCKNPQTQNFSAFEREVDNYRAKFKNQIPMLEQTIISITNRLRRLFYGPMKMIFSQTGRFTVNELFSKRVCVDLGSIIRLGGEKRDALFFLNMIFKYLWDRNLSRGAIDEPSHMCVLEDAQYMIPQSLLKQSKLSTYIEDVALLQRGTGEILVSISTRPAVSEDVLANAGIFISFQSHYDTSQIQELLGLNSDQLKLVGTLQEGECIVRVATIPRPFLLKIPLLRKTLKFQKALRPPNSSLKNFSVNKMVIRKQPNKIFVGYFHNIRGPQSLAFSTSILNQEDSQRILANMERGEGSCELSFDEGHYLLNVFEVPSSWGRGNVELFMIGTKLEPQEEISRELKEKFSQFVEKIKKNLSLFKICYYDRLSEEPYKTHSEEIKQEYAKFYDAINELEEQLFSNRHLKGTENRIRVSGREKLNPAQFEALNELNDFIEQLLSKEK